jgi:hypothetical protein
VWRRAEDAAEIILFSRDPFIPVQLQVNTATAKLTHTSPFQLPPSQDPLVLTGKGAREKVDQRHSGQVAGSWPSPGFSC